MFSYNKVFGDHMFFNKSKISSASLHIIIPTCTYINACRCPCRCVNACIYTCGHPCVYAWMYMHASQSVIHLNHLINFIYIIFMARIYIFYLFHSIISFNRFIPIISFVVYIASIPSVSSISFKNKNKINKITSISTQYINNSIISWNNSYLIFEETFISLKMIIINNKYINTIIILYITWSLETLCQNW